MPGPDAAPALGFLYLICEPVAAEAGAPPAVPPLGAAAWRAVAAASGAPLLGVSAARPSEADDAPPPEALAWLRPCGAALAAAAAAGALVDGTVAAVSPCGTRVMVRAALRCRTGGAARPGAAGAAAAALFAHLRCDWDAADAPALEMRPPACGVAGCRLGCGREGAPADAAAADAADAAAAAGSLAAMLEDLRPPRVDAAAPPVPKAVEGAPNPGDLPAAALDALLCALDPASLRAVAQTCRGLRQRCMSVAPGLHLTLHAHQRDALAWMRAREAPRPPLPAPLWRPLRCADGATTVWAHELTGQLAPRPPPRCADARGGLLCDEPGLGKTVTVIALLLATRGVRAAPPRACAAQRDADGAAWYAAAGGEDDAEEEAADAPAQQGDANSPMPWDDAAMFTPPPRISMNGGSGALSPSPSPAVGGSGRARRASAESLTRLGHFAALLSAKEAGRTPDPRGASDAGDDVASSRVYLATTTLVICPAVLLAHWLAQLAPAAAAGRLRVGVADAAGAGSGGAGAELADWCPDLEAVPPAELASRWDVLLLPLHRLSHAHGAGGGALLRVRWLRIVLDEGHALGASLGLTSRLAVARALKAERRWVVTGTPTPAALRAGQLAHLRPLLAFIREGAWGLAPEKAWAAAVQRPLEADAAGSSGDATAFGFGEMARRAAASRLAAVLRRVAARTRKADIALRPAVRVETLLRFNAAHASHYNDLAAHVRRALLLADWGDPSHEQSLLHARNAGLGRAAAENLREAACVAGRAAYLLAAGEAERSMAALEAALRRRGRAGEGLEARLARCEAALRAGRGACDACGRRAPVPLVTPCGHVLCCDCVAKGSATAHHARDADGVMQEAPAAAEASEFEVAPTGCAACGESYRMQGVYPRADNPSPRQAVPQDLIELQPGYEHSGWAVDWEAESQGHSSKVAYLLRRLREVGAAPLPADEVPPAAQAAAQAAGAWPWPQPDAAAVAARASRAQRAAAAAALAAAPPGSVPPPPPPPPPVRVPPVFPAVSKSGDSGGRIPKAIVYSSFHTHLHVIDLALTGAGVPFSTLRRLGFTRRDKEAALAAFRHDPLTRVLLLDRAGAEGLDLSFASHIFLCEPLADAALEAQVISRAHRMGQTGVVRAEILAMHGTAEATLLEARRGGGGGSGEALSRRAILTALRLAPVPAAAAGGGDVAAGEAECLVVSTRRCAVEAPPAKAPAHYARAPAEAPPGAASPPPADADAAPGGGDGGGGSDDAAEDDAEDEAAMDAAAAGETSEDAPPADDDDAGGGGDDSDDDDDAGFDPALAWTLRLRGPQLPPSGAALALPKGGATPLRELRRRAAVAAGLEAATLRMRAGFPPRLLDADSGAGGASTAAQAGLTDRDVLSLEGTAAAASPGMPSPPAAAPMAASALAPPAAASGAKPARKRAAGGSRKFPGKARRIGVAGAPPPGGAAASAGDAAMPGSYAALEAEALAEAGPMAAAALAAGFEADSSWLVGGGGGPESGLGAELFGAAHGGGGGRDAVAMSLRRAMSAAVEQRAADAEGAARLAAASAGAVRFEPLADGRLAVTFSAPSARGASAVSRQDCVADLPRIILPFVLRLVLGDASDAACRANMQPQNMAVASPRMFWAVVRHGGVGPTRSFAQALATLVPGVDWEAVTRRDRQRPERYRPGAN